MNDPGHIYAQGQNFSLLIQKSHRSTSQDNNRPHETYKCSYKNNRNDNHCNTFRTPERTTFHNLCHRNLQ